jgi:hypothetical protein
MKLVREKKLEVVSEVLRLLSTRFTVLTMQQHARQVAQTSDLPAVEPSFGSGQVQ